MQNEVPVSPASVPHQDTSGYKPQTVPYPPFQEKSDSSLFPLTCRCSEASPDRSVSSDPHCRQNKSLAESEAAVRFSVPALLHTQTPQPTKETAPCATFFQLMHLKNFPSPNKTNPLRTACRSSAGDYCFSSILIYTSFLDLFLQLLQHLFLSYFSIYPLSLIFQKGHVIQFH